MTQLNYIEVLSERLARFFDIDKDAFIMGEQFNLFASSSVHNERYFGSKSVKIWRAENYEYLFAKNYSCFSENDFSHFTEKLKRAVSLYVKPHSEHMESIITGVIITEQEPDLRTQSLIKSFHYRRNYKLTLHGWSEIRLILVIPSLNKGISNKKGKEVLNFYLSECHKSTLGKGIQKLKSFSLNKRRV